MRRINGCVCVSTYRNSGIIILFGKRIDESLKQSYENIQTNGFILFENKKGAAEGKKELEQREDILHTKLAKLKMDIAENDKDLEKLINESSLVAIKYSEMGDDFLGSYVEGMPSAHPLPGAYLRANGLQPYDEFNSAEYAAQEIARQAQCRASIATFYLEYLDK